METFLGDAQQLLFGVSVFDPINCIIKNLQAEIFSFFLLEVWFGFSFFSCLPKGIPEFSDNFIISDLSPLQISPKQRGPRVAQAAA